MKLIVISGMRIVALTWLVTLPVLAQSNCDIPAGIDFEFNGQPVDLKYPSLIFSDTKPGAKTKAVFKINNRRDGWWFPIFNWDIQRGRAKYIHSETRGSSPFRRVDNDRRDYIQVGPQSSLSTFEIEFAPTQSGDYDDVFMFRFLPKAFSEMDGIDLSLNCVFNFSVRGSSYVGEPAKFEILGISTHGERKDLFPSSDWNLGTATLGSTLEAKFILKNSGARDLSFARPPEISGAGFSLKPGAPALIKAASEGELIVQFQKPEKGIALGTLTLFPNDPSHLGKEFRIYLAAEIGDPNDPRSLAKRSYRLAPLSLLLGERNLPLSAPFEFDLGSYRKKATSEDFPFRLKNISSSTLKLELPRIGPGFKISTASFKKTLASGEVTTFQVKVDTSKAGVVSSHLIISEAGKKEILVDLRIGALVWGATMEETEQGNFSVSPSPSPAPHKVQDPENRPQPWGYDMMVLNKLKSGRDFEAAMPTLPLSPEEKSLKALLGSAELDQNLWTFFLSSQRSVLSLGAAETLKSVQSVLADENATTLVARLSRLINEGSGDDAFGKAKSRALLSLAMLPHIKEALRVYAQLMLTSGLIDKLPDTNALGRFYMRMAFLKAYLMTNPPLAESKKLLGEILSSHKDEIQKSMLIDQWMAFYPQIAAVAEQHKSSP